MFAERLKEARDAKGMTRKEIAKFLGMTERGYQNYERGMRIPGLWTLKQIANYLGVSTDYLLGISGEPSVLDSDPLLESLKELKEEYHSTGDFIVNGTIYSIDQMMEELKNNTEIGLEYRKNVNKMILTYMMKFGGDEDN